MNKSYRNYYLNRPPAPLFKAKLDNIVIVPASMLPFKDKWEEVVNALPSGSVLIYHSSTNAQQRKILDYVERSFRAKGHAVTNFAIESS